MQPDKNTKEPLKELWEEEIAARKQAQGWGNVSNVGFVGLVATELPEFIAKTEGARHSWRLPLFIASGASVVSGVVMNWIKGNKAEKLRETALRMEHTHKSDGEPGQWSAKIAAEQGLSPTNTSGPHIS